MQASETQTNQMFNYASKVVAPMVNCAEAKDMFLQSILEKDGKNHST